MLTCLNYFRVIGLGVDEEQPFDMAGLENSFSEAYAKLAQLQPITCAKTGEEFSPQKIHPDAALIDVSSRIDLCMNRSDIYTHGSSCSVPR